MPRVSEEHLEARRRQILQAARACFTRNGFHSTSMKDVLNEAGLSAGAVYRYFPSKESIIAAIALEAIGELRASIESSGESSVLELIARAVEAVERRAAADDVGRLALQVWAEGARSETLRAQLADAVRSAREALATRLEPAHGRQAAEDMAVVITSMLPGYVHARTIVGGMDPERYVRGVEALVTAAAPVARRSGA